MCVCKMGIQYVRAGTCTCINACCVCLYVCTYICLSNPLTVPPAIPHFKEVIVMARHVTLVATAPMRSSQGQGSVQRGHGSRFTSLTPVTSQGTY